MHSTVGRHRGYISDIADPARVSAGVRHSPMSYIYPVTPDHPLCGTWVAMCPDESCDYPRTEYTISVADGQFYVTGIDPVDGEQFIIYDVGYDGESIRFVSNMPSTGRTGRNWLRIVDRDKVEFRFTFTERELWVRKPFSYIGMVIAPLIPCGLR